MFYLFSSWCQFHPNSFHLLSYLSQFYVVNVKNFEFRSSLKWFNICRTFIKNVPTFAGSCHSNLETEILSIIWLILFYSLLHYLRLLRFIHYSPPYTFPPHPLDFSKGEGSLPGKLGWTKRRNTVTEWPTGPPMNRYALLQRWVENINGEYATFFFLIVLSFVQDFMFISFSFISFIYSFPFVGLPSARGLGYFVYAQTRACVGKVGKVWSEGRTDP